MSLAVNLTFDFSFLPEVDAAWAGVTCLTDMHLAA